MKFQPHNKTLIATAILILQLVVGTDAIAAPGLEEILMKKGILTQDDLTKIRSGNPLEDILLEKKVISRDEWSRVRPKQTMAQQEVPAATATEEKRGYAVETGTKGILIKSDDGDFAFGVGGRVQADAAFFFPNEPYGNGAEIRRVRLKGYGKIWRDWSYKAEIDFAEQAELTDGWLAYTGFNPFIIKIGHQKVPFSLESATSSNWQVFQERALTDAFIDTDALGRRRLGITGSWYGGNHFFVRTGIFGQGVNDDGTFNQSWGTATRVVWAPILGEGKLLHLGGAMYYREFNLPDGNQTLRFRARPEAHISGIRLADTGNLVGTQNVIMGEAEASGVWGPFHAQGEFVDSTVQRKGQSDLHFYGWYTQIGYFLTGESRNYSQQSAQFKGIKPHRIVGQGGYGAWELAARYSYIDLSGNNGLNGGRERNITLGINWWANQNIVFRLNYINAYAYPNSSHNVLGVTNQTLNIIEGRAQVVF